MKNIVEYVEKLVIAANGQAKSLRLNSIGGVVGNARRDLLNEWVQLRKALTRGETVGRLQLAKLGNDENDWQVLLVVRKPVVTATTKRKIEQVAAIVEEEVRKLTGNVHNVALSNIKIAGSVRGANRCTSAEWRELVDALRNGPIGKLAMIMPTVNQNTWAMSVMADVQQQQFPHAADYAVAIVNAEQAVHISALGAIVTSHFGPAAWDHVIRELIRTGSEKAADNQKTIWRNNAGLLSLDKNALAARADSSSTVFESPKPAAPAPQTVAPIKIELMPTSIKVEPAAPTPRMHAGIFLIDTLDLCRNAMHELSALTAVGVDCEGSLDNDADFYLRLVQVGAPEGKSFRAFVFDMQFAADAETKREIEHGLRRLLSSESVVKVFHDLRHDVPALCRHLQLDRNAVRAIFDTQVAFEALAEQRLLPRRFEGPRASLNDVLKAFDLPINAQKRVFQAEFDRVGAAVFWRRRELSKAEIDYAADDVRHLVTIHDKTQDIIREGLLTWSQRYSTWFDDRRSHADENDDDAICDMLCRLTFQEVERNVSRLVPVEIAEDDDVARAQAKRVGMPPPSDAVCQAFEPEFDAFVAALPAAVRIALLEMDMSELRVQLVEVIVDVGFAVVLYFRDGRRHKLHDCIVEEWEMEETETEWNNRNVVIGHDNRIALEQTLHRISVKRGRLSGIDGLTCRVGKHCPGAASLLRDVVAEIALRGKSALLLGPPGAGKTTLLREIARLLADEYGKRVDVVDSSNEIAGDGARKHYAIGDARRTAVPLALRSNTADAQALVMREVIANHTPQVLVVDELGTREQCRVAASIAERGAALVATVHGRELVDLRRNSELNSLLGGFQTTTVSDAEWRRLGAKSKNVAMRNGAPVFDIVIELRQVGEYIVHANCSRSVDALLALRGSETPPSVVSHRWSDVDGGMWVRYEQFGGSAAVAHTRTGGTDRTARNARGWLAHLQQ